METTGVWASSVSSFSVSLHSSIPLDLVTRRTETYTRYYRGNRFDILNTRLYKTYVNLTNIILRISDGTEEGKEHAVLLNAHLDSTLPSPGAADDALPGGVMLEVARNLVLTKTWEPSFSVIFCECFSLLRRFDMGRDGDLLECGM